MEELTKPIFLPDSNLLPERSKGFKLRVLDHDMNDILDDTTIPEDLKIKLFLLLKRKYDHVKTNNDNNSNTPEKFENDVNPRSIINKIVQALPKSQRVDGRRLADILMNQSKNLKWDNEGNIIYPVMKNLGSFDLNLLFKSLLQQKGVLNEHTKIAAKIIRPFYEILEQEDLLINRKLSAMFAKEKDVNLSQYVGW